MSTPDITFIGQGDSRVGVQQNPELVFATLFSPGFIHDLTWQINVGLSRSTTRIKESIEAQGRSLPNYVQREFEEFPTCGRLEHGFLRAGYEERKHERLVAFSCTNSRRCRRTERLLPEPWGTRRMVESKALLEDVLSPGEGAYPFKAETGRLSAKRPSITN
jgi:hypothetical protein